MANIYQEYEQAGRNEFKSWANSNPMIWNLQFSEGEYDKFDGVMYSGYSLASIEIKKRKHNHDTVWPGQPKGFILEKTKYDGLKAVDSDEQYFITIFDDAMAIWNITDMKPEWMTVSYSSNHTRSVKVNKEVCYLPIEMASHIILKPKSDEK